MNLNFYTAKNILNLSQGSEFQAWEHSMLLALISEPMTRFIANTDATMEAVRLGEMTLPIVISNPQAQQNSYVCSTTSHYIDYAREELDIEFKNNPVLHKALDALIRTARLGFLPLGFEKAVFINNWLLSTNLYPVLNTEQLHLLKKALIQRFPDHAIIFRSVNTRLSTPLFNVLQTLDFVPIISRQVYILDTPSGIHRKRHSFKEDLRHARRSQYRWLGPDEIQTQQIPRLKMLYDDLYLKKYSYYNPQFTSYFFQQSLKHCWLNYYALEKDGRIDGMLAYTFRNGVMTTPMVGYDQTLPKSTQLYPQITAKIFKEAERLNLVLNHSSGVSRFKMNRGCEPAMEYNLIYYKHLPRAQQMPWKALQALSKYVAGPVLKKFEL